MAAFPLVSHRYRLLLAKAVGRWVHASGFDWTKERVGALVQYLLKLRAGENPCRPPWWSSRYLSYAERVATAAPFEKFLQLVQAWRTALTAYGRLKSVPSRRDVEKFEKAVGSARILTVPLASGRVVEVDTEDWRSRFPFRAHFGVSPRQALPEVRIHREVLPNNPLSLKLTTGKGYYTPTGEELFRDAWWIMQDHVLHPPGTVPTYWPMLPVLPDFRPKPGQGRGHGAVRCRVQPDGKARFYFAPPRWLQFLLDPWARELYSQLKKIPQDFTYNQAAGAELVAEWLRSGKTVWSFDLSSATDLFPLPVTRTVLWSLSSDRNRPWVDLFCWISRLPARTAYPGARSEVIKWRCGQPLGTVPSFAAFALSHHAVVRALWARLGGDPRSAPYCIVGDDLVIADPRLAEAYRDCSALLGLEISEPKSLAGGLGEFVGRLIAPDGIGFKLKAPPGLDARTLAAYLSLIGTRALRIWEQSLLRDVIALIPREGYPGSNPGGLPREAVDQFLVEYFSREREVEPPRVYAVDPDHTVEARIGPLYSMSLVLPRDPTTTEWEPRGSAKSGPGGAPEPSPYGERVPGSDRSPGWLRRVREAIHASGIAQVWRLIRHGRWSRRGGGQGSRTA